MSDWKQTRLCWRQRKKWKLWFNDEAPTARVVRRHQLSSCWKGFWDQTELLGGSAGSWNRDLWLIRQVLYRWATCPLEKNKIDGYGKINSSVAHVPKQELIFQKQKSQYFLLVLISILPIYLLRYIFLKKILIFIRLDEWVRHCNLEIMDA